MRELSISNCEKEFILKALTNKQRIDGRECYDYRQITVSFGVDVGCCTVQLGKTRVMTQVSCEVTPPKQARPSEGIIFVNVELSPMAAPHFETGRSSEYGTEISRILERCIKESRCVDTESLCIMAGLKVWTIRVDIHVLNHDGNLIDASSMSAIAALAHFRRPDVTVSGEEVTIYSVEDRDPVPLSVHHMPICVTFGFYEQGKYTLVDPNEREERVMDGKMVIGMNKHREICTLQLTGSIMLLKEQVLRSSNIAVVKVAEVTELIQQALENDAKARAAGAKFGFAASIVKRKVTAHSVAETETIDVDTAGEMETGEEDEDEEIIVGDTEDFESKIVSKDANTITIADGGSKSWKPTSFGEGGQTTWTVDEKERINELQSEQKMMWKKLQMQGTTDDDAVVIDSDDDEEADTVTLQAGDLQEAKIVARTDTIDLTSALISKPAAKVKKPK